MPEDTRMFERLFGGKEQDTAVAERIPPGQYFTEKWPVLHYGSVPRVDLETWDFKVWGEVDNPFEFDWAEFKADATQAAAHGHPLRDALVPTGHGLRGRRDPDHPREREAAPDCPLRRLHAEQGYTTNLPV